MPTTRHAHDARQEFGPPVEDAGPRSDQPKRTSSAALMIPPSRCRVRVRCLVDCGHNNLSLQHHRVTWASRSTAERRCAFTVNVTSSHGYSEH